MKQASGYRDIVWMLPPVILLAGIGLYFQAARSGQPFGVKNAKPVLNPIKVFPATPRDVARGYDTVVEISAVRYLPSENTTSLSDTGTYTSPMPNFGGNLYLGEKPLEKQTDDIMKGYCIVRGSSPSVGTIRYTLKLAALPPSAQKISLRGTLRYDRVTAQAGKATYFKPGYTLPFSVIVRQPHQKMVTPVVSRDCPLRVYETTSSPLPLTSPNGTVTHETTIEVTVQSLLDGEGTLDFTGAGGRLVGETGGRFTPVPPSSQGSKYVDWSWSQGRAGQPDLCKFTFQYEAMALPTGHGTLWFEQPVSVNDCWPLRLRVLLSRSKESDPKVGTVKAEPWPPGDTKPD